MHLTVLDERDNVGVCPDDLMKYALCDIAQGDVVIKYGCRIGRAVHDIKAGEIVHTLDLASDLRDHEEYYYEPSDHDAKSLIPAVFSGFRRLNGKVGIRNDLLIVPTVSCVTSVAGRIADAVGGIALDHPYGCSQLGGDAEETMLTLAGLIKNPDVGGALVLGLGCENNCIDTFLPFLEGCDMSRLRFMNAQDHEDDESVGTALAAELKDLISDDKREIADVSELVVGLKCGGSDAMSGITANPLVGRISDRIAAMGGSVVMTEVPEMFGAENELLRRCADKDVFDKCAGMINSFKDYFLFYGQPVGENPSPGNKSGGITTLEEKSLGCIKKGGNVPVVDVIKTGQPVTKKGLTLLDGPGNDAVSSTKLAAAGCQLILFTTGRGTPYGTIVPTVKISSNTDLYNKKRGWIDFDAGRSGINLTDELFELILDVCSGRKTKNEINDNRTIAIFKNGVTL